MQMHYRNGFRSVLGVNNVPPPFFGSASTEQRIKDLKAGLQKKGMANLPAGYRVY